MSEANFPKNQDLFLLFLHTNLVAENLSQVIGSPVQAGDSIFSSQQSLSLTRHTW